MMMTPGSKLSFLKNKLTAVFILLLALLALIVPAKVLADVTTSHDVQITATVNGPPPTVASAINSPTQGQGVTSIPITISGTCPQDGLIIKVFDNGIFIGSTVCKNSGHFSVSVDLFKGKNQLVIKEYDSTNQQGPNSQTVTVFYTPTPATSGPGSGSSGSSGAPTKPKQLLVTVDAKYSGYRGEVGRQMSLPIRVHGGKAPYKVNIDWGDGTNEQIELKDSSQPFIATHTYDQSGTYQIDISVVDANGQRATFSLVVVINGPPKLVVPAITDKDSSPWRGAYYYQLLAVLLLIPLGFLFMRARFHHAAPSDHDLSQDP